MIIYWISGILRDNLGILKISDKISNLKVLSGRDWNCPSKLETGKSQYERLEYLTFNDQIETLCSKTFKVRTDNL